MSNGQHHPHVHIMFFERLKKFRELCHIVSGVKNKIFSPKRAIEMAKNIFVRGRFKKLRQTYANKKD